MNLLRTVLAPTWQPTATGSERAVAHTPTTRCDVHGRGWARMLTLTSAAGGMARAAWVADCGPARGPHTDLVAVIRNSSPDRATPFPACRRKRGPIQRRRTRPRWLRASADSPQAAGNGGSEYLCEGQGPQYTFARSCRRHDAGTTRLDVHGHHRAD